MNRWLLLVLLFAGCVRVVEPKESANADPIQLLDVSEQISKQAGTLTSSRAADGHIHRFVTEEGHRLSVRTSTTTGVIKLGGASGRYTGGEPWPEDGLCEVCGLVVLSFTEADVEKLERATARRREILEAARKARR